MIASDLVDRLAQHETFRSAPREELTWLAAHGRLLETAAGDVVASRHTKVEDLWVVLSGRIAIFVERGTGTHKMMEWRAGDVTGLLPYSRMATSPGQVIALEPSTMLLVRGDVFGEMIRECHEITSILVHTMLDRARVFTSSDLHDEKMVSLGKLSAGLAHELNNPASAIERSAALLEDRLEAVEQAARAIGASPLTDAQLAAVDGIRTTCLAARTHGVRSPIEQAEREEAFADWLAHRGLDVANADALAEAPLTLEGLEGLARVVDGQVLNDVLRWVAAECLARRLVSEIRDAATRVSGLVAAIKGFTHMDQAVVAEPVDLTVGLGNTVAVLQSKARRKSAAVVVDTEPDLPRVLGFAGELNQIVANLIDNALDAVPQSGRIEVRANREQGRVVVRIIDNGSGIPEEIRQRVFDPFFTTKPIGEGTGLGLDIVRRLVRHNDGDISFESQPGRTEFRVSLPAVVGDSARSAS